MMKILILSVLILTACAPSANRVPTAASQPIAFFCPQQGPDAYDYLFSLLQNANRSIKMAIYSYRGQDRLEKSLSAALENGATVQIVLHPDLSKKDRMQGLMKRLEEQGAEFKKSYQNMHEKFAIIDGKRLMNTSANMSTGPLTSYSENFIFHNSSTYKDAPFNYLIKQFEEEFALLWNSGLDIVTADEANALPVKMSNERSYSKYAKLYSSSSNWVFTANERRTKTQITKYNQGQYLTYKRQGGSERNQSWIVRDKIIEEIDNATTSIYVAINHFNITEIAEALIRAVKRGVDVKMAVDNQEFALDDVPTIARTPLFVREWKKIKEGEAPVRIKFYSLRPSYMFWFLNHHKYLLIDYETKPTLISGSYNISRNAEHKQFDNIVVYKSSRYKQLYSDFYNEFQHLWNYNIEQKDELLKKMETPYRGAYRLHLKKNAISISWEEATKLFTKIKELAPGIFGGPKSRDHCGYYHPAHRAFFNYGQNGLVPCY